MTSPQFHEGQEVEVAVKDRTNFGAWRKGKIIARQDWEYESFCKRWLVQFPDGSRAVFEADHIKTVSP